jgi:hypothetical protein
MRASLWLLAAGCAFRPGSAETRDGAATTPDTARGDAARDASTLDQGMIAWYEMESIGGDVAIDSTGHGHTGTCSQCPTVVTAHLGRGFHFDGTTRVDIGDSGAFDTSAFTVATWVEYTSLNASLYECPVGKVLDSTIFNSWELCYDANTGDWLYDTVAPPSFGGYAFASLEPPSGPVVGTWYHTAMVWDGTTKTLYIDGTAVASSLADVAFANGMPLSFGADIDYGSQSSPFVGVMDDLRIYGRALDAAEIAALAAQ